MLNTARSFRSHTGDCSNESAARAEDEAPERQSRPYHRPVGEADRGASEHDPHATPDNHFGSTGVSEVQRMDWNQSCDQPALSEMRPLHYMQGRPDVHLDSTDLVLRMEGAEIGLTRTQFSILAYLVENAGRWVTTRELIRQVLGTHHQPDTSLVRVHVHAIRRRLGERAFWLESDRRRARGYRWRDLEVDSHDAAAQKSS